MAMETIDAHLITQFSDLMHVKAQQTKARLKPYVNIKRMTGEIFAYDGIGDLEARETLQRFATIVFDDIEHTRRKMAKRRFYITVPIDQHDVEGMLKDPSGIYATECVKAMERVFDRVVYQAMFAAVDTGRDFSTNVSYATDGGLTVNCTSTGLTYPKLLEMDQNWIDREVGNDMDVRKVFGFGGAEHTQLMQLIQLVNRDYSQNVFIDKGKVAKVMDFDVIKYGASARTPLINVTAGTRDCFAMAENGMIVGMAHDMEISIEKRNDLLQTKQIVIVLEMGAVRTEGKLLQKVQTV